MNHYGLVASCLKLLFDLPIDGARSKCKCDTEFEPRAPGADTNLFVTMESTITLEFAGVGITALLASGELRLTVLSWNAPPAYYHLS